MKDRIHQFFAVRQGMDELSKALFWAGLAGIFLSALCSVWVPGLAMLLLWLGLMLLIFSFVRAFSRRLSQRETENLAYLQWRQRLRAKRLARRDRLSQRRDFRFFKCPGCGAWLRVPRGKGKIHINCKCGYTLYRKT